MIVKISGVANALATRRWADLLVCEHLAWQRVQVPGASGAAATRLWWFGRLIANNDMHLGNLSFHPQAGRLRLAPAYDMLPMAFTPLPGGEVPEPRWDFELPLPAERAAWQAAGDAALLFWADAASDARISPGFRARAAELGQRLNVLLDQA